MNFTSESMGIIGIFLGMTLISFLISLPHILKKEETVDKDSKLNY